jgi:hypothetical protein
VSSRVYPSNSFSSDPEGVFCRITEQAVSSACLVSTDEIRLERRGPARVALARQIAMYLTHVGGGISLTCVGRVYGRDRTTVAHACGLVEDRRDDPQFDRALDVLEQVVRGRALRSFEPAVAVLASDVVSGDSNYVH